MRNSSRAKPAHTFSSYSLYREGMASIAFLGDQKQFRKKGHGKTKLTTWSWYERKMCPECSQLNSFFACSHSDLEVNDSQQAAVSFRFKTSPISGRELVHVFTKCGCFIIEVNKMTDLWSHIYVYVLNKRLWLRWKTPIIILIFLVMAQGSHFLLYTTAFLFTFITTSGTGQ